MRLGFRVKCSGFRFWNSGLSIEGVGFRALDARVDSHW